VAGRRAFSGPFARMVLKVDRGLSRSSVPAEVNRGGKQILRSSFARSGTGLHDQPRHNHSFTFYERDAEIGND
jgi:hypothetical protein